jgi:hypothetical protein
VPARRARWRSAHRSSDMSIDGVSAILLISEEAEKLADFYRDALGIPL